MTYNDGEYSVVIKAKPELPFMAYLAFPFDEEVPPPTFEWVEWLAVYSPLLEAWIPIGPITSKQISRLRSKL